MCCDLTVPLQMHEVLDDYSSRSGLPDPLSLPHTLGRNLCLLWQYTLGQISKHSKVDPEDSTRRKVRQLRFGPSLSCSSALCQLKR